MLSIIIIQAPLPTGGEGEVPLIMLSPKQTMTLGGGGLGAWTIYIVFWGGYMLPTTFYGNQKQPLINVDGSEIRRSPVEAGRLFTFIYKDYPIILHWF